VLTAGTGPVNGNIQLLGGDVGIGTVSPADALDVYGGGIHLGSSTPGSTSNALYAIGTTLYWNGATIGTSGGGGSGTVTSVTFTGDGTVESSTPSSAVTSSGTVTATLANAAAGTVLGNATSSSAAPTYTTNPQLGESGTLGSLTMGNATSGLLTLEPAAGALGTVTVSIPAATDTLVNLSGTQTLTNKSIDGSEINSGVVGTPYGGLGANEGSATGAVSMSSGATTVGTLSVGNGGTGAASFMAGTLLTGNGTSAIGTSAASAIGASMVLIGTATASNSASVIFTGIPSGYDEYQLVYTNVIPTTNLVTMGAQFTEDNGSTYKSSSNYATGAFLTTATGTTGSSGSGTYTSVQFTGDITIDNNTNSPGISGVANFFGLASSTVYKQWTMLSNPSGSGTDAVMVAACGVYNGDTGAVNGMRIFMSSGNIMSGDFALYGIRKQ
jgi:hypothetical protein